ncbi:MAG: flavin reductase family protein [Deltaproteobacteria bacterium]|nr:flavin reductase family protein [Deltaproteobacteria bacterium]
MSVDTDSFKAAMRRWASGVTVVTAKGDAGDAGMTVSAFSSVSAEPPLVVVCLHASTRTHAAVEASERFVVNLLSSEQEALSDRFASSKGDRFEGLVVGRGQTGAALLEGTIARLECELVSAHREGTHTLFVGRVLEATTAPGEPLLYAEGGYRRLAP